MYFTRSYFGFPHFSLYFGEDDGGGGSIAGLRVYYGGAVRLLSLVAVGDAPAGDTPMVRKGGTTYAVYLVDTSDPDASLVRVRTSEGTKSIRLLT